MLQLIFGKPAAGKTYTIIEKIKELTLCGEKSVLIVPEQFTFESERAILKALGDKFALGVEVLSFTRLYDEAGRNIGGIAGKVLNDCDKVVFMKQALDLSADELKLWSRYIHSISFAKTLLDTIGEFKINAVTPEKLREIAEITEIASLKSKLLDIALIYENYDALLGEKFIDPADSLTKLYRSLNDVAYFKGKTVFIDSFKGFTGQQYKIIERILSQADNVYISFTNDVEITKEFNLYTNIRKSVADIEKIAKSYNVNISKPFILGEPYNKSKGILELEALISGRTNEAQYDDGSVNICFADTPIDEVEFVARTIRKLVRENGYRYRDFVVIARDANQYAEAIISACKKNEISLFCDKKIPLSSFPLAVAGECAINAINYSTENILRFHKTGLGTLSYDEISILENYVYIWNINGELWLKEWDMNPNGLSTEKEEQKQKNKDLLAKINQLRVKAIEPIETFKLDFNTTAKDMATALVKLFETCKVSKKLALMCDLFNGDNEAFLQDALRQSYDEYMKILDSLVNCFGVKNIKKDEFAETLSLAVSLSEVGIIPQALDQVSFGSADRIRTSQPKVAFILGANQGVFPKTIHNAGVLNISERKFLIENGMNVADNSVYSSIDEEFLVYCNLCCSSEKIYISCYGQSLSAQKAEPSTFLNNIKSNLTIDVIREPQIKLTSINAPETESAVFGEYCHRINKDITAAASLKTAISNLEVGKKIEFIENNTGDNKKELTPDTAKALFGKDIKMSASKFDVFNRCRFSYFCKYGLNVNKLQPADFDVLQRGTIVHYVLERFINEQKDNLSYLGANDFEQLTEQYINEYLDSVSGFKSVINARNEFLISRITRSLKEVVQHIATELLQSDFKPIACELKIGEEDSLSFPYDSGNMLLTGSIDRVDKYNGYIRIIDYKTGSKKFKLPDILFGLNLQMLIYLYAVTRSEGIDDSLAAGILYQPSKRDTNDDGMAMNGLLQLDYDLYSAMDKEGKGDFVPTLSVNKDGSLSKRCTSFIKKEGFSAIFDHIEKLMQKTGNTIAAGDISVSPIDGRESPACKYCDFKSVCGIENSEVPRVPELDNEEVFEMMKEGENNGI